VVEIPKVGGCEGLTDGSGTLEPESLKKANKSVAKAT
jgi:hypothetical protein